MSVTYEIDGIIVTRHGVNGVVTIDEEFWRSVNEEVRDRKMNPEKYRLLEERQRMEALEEKRRLEEQQRLERARQEEQRRRQQEEQRRKLEKERIRLEAEEMKKKHEVEMASLLEKVEITETVGSALNKFAEKKLPVGEFAVGAVAASSIVARTEMNSKIFERIAQKFQKAIKASGDEKPALPVARNSEGICRSWNEIHAELDKIKIELNKQQTAEDGKLLLERLRDSLGEAKRLAEEDAKGEVIQMTKNLLDVIHGLESDEKIFMQKATVSCCVLGEQFPELIDELMKLINDYIK